MSASNASQPSTASQAPLQVQTSLANAAPTSGTSATSPARAKAAAALAASGAGNATQDMQAASAGVAELTTAVDALLDDMRRRYGDVGRELLGRMDEMSRRLDALEANLRGGGGGTSNSTKGSS